MRRPFLAAVLAVAALAFAGAAPGLAQTLRLQSLVIDGAGVRLDGQPVRDVEAPGAFAFDRLGEEAYRFEGPIGSTVEINGVRYRLDGGRLTLDHALDVAPAAVFRFDGGRSRRFGTRSLVGPDEVARYASEQEWALEATAFDLALRIRALPFGTARASLVTDLRRHLSETFALKQSLRFRELEALEADVRALRAQLEARERQRDRLVERRLEALVGR